MIEELVTVLQLIKYLVPRLVELRGQRFHLLGDVDQVLPVAGHHVSVEHEPSQQDKPLYQTRSRGERVQGNVVWIGYQPLLGGDLVRLLEIVRRVLSKD